MTTPSTCNYTRRPRQPDITGARDTVERYDASTRSTAALR